MFCKTLPKLYHLTSQSRTLCPPAVIIKRTVRLAQSSASQNAESSEKKAANKNEQYFKHLMNVHRTQEWESEAALSKFLETEGVEYPKELTATKEAVEILRESVQQKEKIDNALHTEMVNHYNTGPGETIRTGRRGQGLRNVNRAKIITDGIRVGTENVTVAKRLHEQHPAGSVDGNRATDDRELRPEHKIKERFPEEKISRPKIKQQSGNLWHEELQSRAKPNGGEAYLAYNSSALIELEDEEMVQNSSSVNFVPSPAEDDLAEIEELSKYEVDALSTEVPDEVKEMGQFVPKSYNLAAYVHRSPLLQELVKLGVDLSVWETKEGVADMILMKDFDNDIKPYITFLCDIGVPAEKLGEVFTKAPMIFDNDLDDLQVRVNYLKEKRFTDEAISWIVCKAPAWLTYDVRTIDGRLGYLQRMFHLTGNELRQVVTRQPKLAFWWHVKLKELEFSITGEMGFTETEAKQLLLTYPKLWTQNRMMVLSIFNYLHNTMGIPHEIILECPESLMTRLFKFQQRHQYLERLGKARYDPLKPGFVSLEMLAKLSDAEFCSKVAKTPIEDFNDFLKTL